MSAPDLDAIQARLDAATPGPWQWRGNIDNGEPYLASRGPGMGASVLAIGTADREMTGRRADEVRSYAEESGLDPERQVENWATDRYGEPIKDPRLWFYTDHLAVEARDRVRFEVAPNATSRDDRGVYRADIVGINHPDAELIAHAPADLAALLAEVKHLTAERDEARAALKAFRGDVEGVLNHRDEQRGVSCGGLDVFADGCFVGDLARRLAAVLANHPTTKKARCGSREAHAAHSMPCDSGCQPDWHRDDCAIYGDCPGLDTNHPTTKEADR